MNIYLQALVISIVYLIIKYLQIKYYQKEEVSLKELFSESLIIYGCVGIGVFIYSNITTIMENIDENVKNPIIFTNKPDF